MMNNDSLLLKLAGAGAPLCAANIASTDLAAVTQTAIEAGARYMSVAPSGVEILWPWVEKTNIKIAARFTPAADGAWDECISDFSANVNAAFKRGAHTAQVFVRASELENFVTALRPIRDDLFFCRELEIAIDLSEIDFDDWGMVFGALARIGANSLLIALTRDAGDKSDFVGRIYGMFGAINEIGWGGALHFALGLNQTRIEQVQRLAGAMCPNALANMIFFVNN